MTKINISYAIFALNQFQVTRVIRKCINEVLKQENISAACEVNVLITDDAGIRTINKAFRDIDNATDVLSFPMFQLEAGAPPASWEDYIDAETGLVPLGDMAISLERAVAQAKEFGHSSRREIGYLTIHSMLHLLGYDHMDEGPEKAQMRSREEDISSRIPRMNRS